jgi:hypothetical protein
MDLSYDKKLKPTSVNKYLGINYTMSEAKRNEAILTLGIASLLL